MYHQVNRSELALELASSPHAPTDVIWIPVRYIYVVIKKPSRENEGDGSASMASTGVSS